MTPVSLLAGFCHIKLKMRNDLAIDIKYMFKPFSGGFQGITRIEVAF